MRPPNCRGPPHKHGNDPPIDEPPAKTLATEFSDNNATSQGAPSSAVVPADASPISSIACAFGQEILLGAAKDLSELASSYAASAAEAAWRGDVKELGVHLQHAGSAIQSSAHDGRRYRGRAVEVGHRRADVSMSVDAERARLQRLWPAEFADGERCGFIQRPDGPRELGGYPKAFHAWPVERRNAWWCGFNFGLCERQRALMRSLDG